MRLSSLVLGNLTWLKLPDTDAHIILYNLVVSSDIARYINLLSYLLTYLLTDKTWLVCFNDCVLLYKGSTVPKWLGGGGAVVTSIWTFNYFCVNFFWSVLFIFSFELNSFRPVLYSYYSLNINISFFLCFLSRSHFVILNLLLTVSLTINQVWTIFCSHFNF